MTAIESTRTGNARLEAAADRTRASQDRVAAAIERSLAKQDRTTAYADRATAATDREVGAAERSCAGVDRYAAFIDRGEGADERGRAELDRNKSLTDRTDSAGERINASFDELTGVYRRSPGITELNREITRVRRTGESMVLAFLDVDHLKNVNDSRGHSAGDQLLREVADIFRAELRSHDLIIRYGGDEFVCVIAGLQISDAAMRLARANATLAQGSEHGSVSVGLAELRQGDSSQDLIARADAELYRERDQQRRTPR